MKHRSVSGGFPPAQHVLRRISLCIGLLVALTAVVPAQAVKIRPLSKGWYRLPYGEALDGKPTDLTGILHDGNNLFLHGHNGYDLLGLNKKAWNHQRPHRIVAMAAGRVIEVEDGFNHCSDSGFGLLPPPCTPNIGGGCPCNNKMWIEHSNGEFSAYYHIAYASAQVEEGDYVVGGSAHRERGGRRLHRELRQQFESSQIRLYRRVSTRGF